MNPLQLALATLVFALLTQFLSTWLLVHRLLIRSGERGLYLTLAGGMLALAVKHARALELLLSTGLYDLEQAVLSAVTALCLGYASFLLARR